MRIVTASNGKKTVKMSKSEWQQIGKTAGWMKMAQVGNPIDVDKLKKFIGLSEDILYFLKYFLALNNQETMSNKGIRINASGNIDHLKKFYQELEQFHNLNLGGGIEYKVVNSELYSLVGAFEEFRKLQIAQDVDNDTLRNLFATANNVYKEYGQYISKAQSAIKSAPQSGNQAPNQSGYPPIK